MDDIAFEKIYVHSDRLATLICPRCGKAKTIDVSHLMKKERSVDIRVRFRCRMCTERPSVPEGGDSNGEGCAGGVCVHATLERRKYYRKKVKLAGLVVLRRKNIRVNVTLLEISKRGITFDVNDPKLLGEGDEAIAEFRLDDSHRTLVRRNVTIRKIREKTVGAQFVGDDCVVPYDKALGFYLMS